MRLGHLEGNRLSHLRVHHSPEQSGLIHYTLIFERTRHKPSLIVEHEEKFVAKKLVYFILAFARYAILSEIAFVVTPNELNVDKAGLL